MFKLKGNVMDLLELVDDFGVDVFWFMLVVMVV